MYALSHSLTLIELLADLILCGGIWRECALLEGGVVELEGKLADLLRFGPLVVGSAVGT